MVLDSNNHSVFTLVYRLILPTYKRAEIIDFNISERLTEIFENIAENYNITLLTWDYFKSYLDITFKAHPNTELSKFINAYKSAGSRLIKKEFPNIPLTEKGQFWHKSFCLLTKEDSVEEVLETYFKKLR